MPTGVPMPNPRFRAFDANGNPLAAGKLYAYQSGTLVAQNTYSDQALTTPNANPVILDANGEATIFIPDGTLYRFILKNSADVQQWDVNAVEMVAPAAPSNPAPVPTGCVLAYGAAAAPSGYALCDGSAINRTTFAALFAVIGTTYGAGDGSTTFNVPDMRGKFPFGKAAAGTGNVLGASFGTIDHTHTGPSHTHNVAVPYSGWGTNTNTPPLAGKLQAGGSGAGSEAGVTQATGDQTVASAAGGNGATGTANPPGLVFNFIIKT
jgi:microcystin-dependent protein